MNRPRFVYVTYIASTPERVWQALTDAAVSKQFWFGYNVSSTWAVGAPFALAKDGTVMDSGTVLECDPPRRLSYTWHPEYDEMKHERPSRVTFVLEPKNDQVKLTVTHEDFEPGSKVFESISGGWPMVLSSLKSLLETGQGLAPTWSGDDIRKIEAAVRAS